MIFILRVAQLHVGSRTSVSGWETFRNYSLRFDVVQTVGCYFLSAYLFSEIYVWSASKEADLNRIKLIPRTDRPMLNERPIYLTSFFFFLALVQSGCHLFYDYDRLDMPVTKTKPLGSPNQLSHILVPPSAQLKSNLPTLMASCLKRSICVSLAAPFVYSINWLYPWSIRKFSWSFTRTWAKIFWNLPKSSSLPSIAPYHGVLIVDAMGSWKRSVLGICCSRAFEEWTTDYVRVSRP
jgi:nucleoporin NDC1